MPTVLPCRSMAAPIAVVLAAGQGTRMRSETPKVLPPICGLPMVLWGVEAARQAGAGRVVVVGGPDRALEPILPDGVELAVQHEPLGTGDAVRAAAPETADPDTTVLILNGDVPLITAEAIRALVAAHELDGAQATVTTMLLDDPGGYGRIVRGDNGTITKIVETKHRSEEHTSELQSRQ